MSNYIRCIRMIEHYWNADNNLLCWLNFKKRNEQKNKSTKISSKKWCNANEWRDLEIKMEIKFPEWLSKQTKAFRLGLINASCCVNATAYFDCLAFNNAFDSPPLRLITIASSIPLRYLIPLLQTMAMKIGLFFLTTLESQIKYWQICFTSFIQALLSALCHMNRQTPNQYRETKNK